MSYHDLLTDPNLQGHWPLQESSGTGVADLSGNDRHGTASSAIFARTGPTAWLPSAIDFSSMQIAFPAAAFVSGNNPRTYCVWFQADTWTATTEENIACFGALSGAAGEKFGICPEDNAVSVFFESHRVITPKSTLSSESWYHLTVRIPNSATLTSSVDIFLDGVKQNLSQESGIPQTLNTQLETSQWLGNDPFGAGMRWFNGGLAGFMSFDRALSDAEIMTLATGESGGSARNRIRRLGLGGNLGVRR
ncbi:MAG: LamG-like jellyroll fold domain-containing protein [Blastopirellula sp. JB062]